MSARSLASRSLAARPLTGRSSAAARSLIVAHCLAPIVATTALLRSTGIGDHRTDSRARARERGDVPGWVLITLMTAGLVTMIWALAGAQLAELFTQAISSVTGPGKR